MRIDQLQRYLNEHGLARAVAYHMSFKHLDWISKDTDMQAEHWPKYTMSWEVPEAPFDLDLWAIDIADKLKLEEAFTLYDPTLDGATGLLMLYGYRIHPDLVAESGWRIVFQYTYIDPTLALM